MSELELPIQVQFGIKYLSDAIPGRLRNDQSETLRKGPPGYEKALTIGHTAEGMEASINAALKHFEVEGRAVIDGDKMGIFFKTAADLDKAIVAVSQQPNVVAEVMELISRGGIGSSPNDYPDSKTR